VKTNLFKQLKKSLKQARDGDFARVTVVEAARNGEGCTFLQTAEDEEKMNEALKRLELTADERHDIASFLESHFDLLLNCKNDSKYWKGIIGKLRPWK